MPEVAHCNTISFNAKNFDYQTVDQINGNASVIKFEIDEKMYSPGDVVVVLSDADICFHGIIGKIENGWAYASDPKDSLLPATVQ
jgi:hypothetical protein